MHKILFVDDEASVLEGYHRTLDREFQLDVACGGAEALLAMERDGPYALVITDMAMPGMNGAEFLAAAREQSPDTVRILVTGFTSLNAAMDAFDHGDIFRFLTKPCQKKTLLKAIGAGLAQFDRAAAERELPDQNLSASIEMMANVVRAASPDAFERSYRVLHYVKHTASRLFYSVRWQLEAAASLSQLGCITLNPDVVQRAFEGLGLTADELTRYRNHPRAAVKLLSSIPSMEPIAWMISHQFTVDIPAPELEHAGLVSADLAMGAKILKLAVAFDDLRLRSVTDANALSRLRSRMKEFDAQMIAALSDVQPESERTEAKRLPITRLAPGMTLNQELRSRAGTLIVGLGQELSRPLIAKLNNFAWAGTIEREVLVLVPYVPKRGDLSKAG